MTPAATQSPCRIPHEPLTFVKWAANLIAVVVPFVAAVAAVALLWGTGVGWTELGLLAVMYVVTTIGINVGYHRLFTHRAFDTVAPVRVALGVFGSMGAQGPLLQWVATHRRHHQHSDTPDDPHTPHHSGRGVWGAVRGMWHSHLGWIFAPVPADMGRYVRDLQRVPSARVVSRLFPAWVAAGLLLPALAGGVLSGTWQGAGLGFLWGGLVRLFLTHHVTFSVNSVCHLWGRRPYPSGDGSRNNWIVALLALGEGWHNNHHAFPTSARHGLAWWQPDVSYWVIRGLAAVGLAWNVKLPSIQAVSAGRR